MALSTNLHTAVRTDIGFVGQGSDIYTASINGGSAKGGVDIPGWFVPLDSGVSLSYQTDTQDFMVAGRVRMVSYQNPTVMISLDCVYAARTMAEALGLGTYKWKSRIGDVWFFSVVTNAARAASDRGNDTNNATIPDFLGRNLFLENGSSRQIPSTDRWSLSLQFKAYLDSPVQNSPKYSTLNGRVIP